MISVRKVEFVYAFSVDNNKQAGQHARYGVTVDGMSVAEAAKSGSPEQQTVARQFQTDGYGMTEVERYDYWKQFPEFAPQDVVLL